MMEIGILSWPAAFPYQKALEISNSSFGDKKKNYSIDWGSETSDLEGGKLNLKNWFEFMQENLTE